MKRLLISILLLCLLCSASVGLAEASASAAALTVQDLYSFADGHVVEPEVSVKELHSAQIFEGSGADLALVNAYVEALLAQNAELVLSRVTEGAETYNYFLEYTGSGEVGDPVQMPGLPAGNLVIRFVNSGRIEILASHGMEFADLGLRNAAEDAERPLLLQDLTSFSDGILPEAYVKMDEGSCGYYWRELEGVDTAALAETYARMLSGTWEELKAHTDRISYILEYTGKLMIGEEARSDYDFEENICILFGDDYIYLAASNGIRFADLGMRC